MSSIIILTKNVRILEAEPPNHPARVRVTVRNHTNDPVAAARASAEIPEAWPVHEIIRDEESSRYILVDFVYNEHHTWTFRDRMVEAIDQNPDVRHRQPRSPGLVRDDLMEIRRNLQVISFGYVRAHAHAYGATKRGDSAGRGSGVSDPTASVLSDRQLQEQRRILAGVDDAVKAANSAIDRAVDKLGILLPTGERVDVDRVDTAHPQRVTKAELAESEERQAVRQSVGEE